MGEAASFLKKLFLAVEHGVLAVNKFSVTGYLTIDDLSSKKYFTLTDQVWMIMEELFDKRRLSLSFKQHFLRNEQQLFQLI